MNTEQIFKLIDAGFSKEDIMALAKSIEKPAELTHEEPAPEEAPATAEPVDNSKDEEIERLNGLVSKLTADVATLTKSIQANNIINTEQPARPVKTAAEILAKIINPYLTDEEIMKNGG